jgi:hypothetical protein
VKSLKDSIANGEPEMLEVKINCDIRIRDGVVTLRHTNNDPNNQDGSLFGFPSDPTPEQLVEIHQNLGIWIRQRFRVDVSSALANS